jgi:hypothetical protein
MIFEKETLIVFTRHGAQGFLDGASKGSLENEFGTKNEDECIMKILEHGNVQETEVRLRKRPRFRLPLGMHRSGCFADAVCAL